MEDAMDVEDTVDATAAGVPAPHSGGEEDISDVVPVRPTASPSGGDGGVVSDAAPPGGDRDISDAKASSQPSGDRDGADDLSLSQASLPSSGYASDLSLSQTSLPCSGDASDAYVCSAPTAASSDEDISDCTVGATVPPRGGDISDVKTVPPRGEDISDVKTVPPRGGDISDVKTVPPRGGDISDDKTVPPRGGDISDDKTVPPSKGEVSDVSVCRAASPSQGYFSENMSVVQTLLPSTPASTTQDSISHASIPTSESLPRPPLSPGAHPTFPTLASTSVPPATPSAATLLSSYASNVPSGSLAPPSPGLHPAVPTVAGSSELRTTACSPATPAHVTPSSSSTSALPSTPSPSSRSPNPPTESPAQPRSKTRVLPSWMLENRPSTSSSGSKKKTVSLSSSSSKTSAPRRGLSDSKTAPPGGKDSSETKTAPPGGRDSSETKTAAPPGGRDSSETKTAPPGGRDSSETKTAPTGGRDSSETKTAPPGGRDSSDMSLGQSLAPVGRNISDTKTAQPGGRDISNTSLDQRAPPHSGRHIPTASPGQTAAPPPRKRDLFDILCLGQSPVEQPYPTSAPPGDNIRYISGDGRLSGAKTTAHLPPPIDRKICDLMSACLTAPPSDGYLADLMSVCSPAPPSGGFLSDLLSVSPPPPLENGGNISDGSVSPPATPHGRDISVTTSARPTKPSSAVHGVGPSTPAPPGGGDGDISDLMSVFQTVLPNGEMTDIMTVCQQEITVANSDAGGAAAPLGDVSDLSDDSCFGDGDGDGDDEPEFESVDALDKDLWTREMYVGAEEVYAGGFDTGWKTENYHYNRAMKFNRKPGLKIEVPPDVTPLQMFEKIWTDTMWQHMIDKTNQHYEQYCQETPNRPKSYKFPTVTRTEMRTFIGLCIGMGLVVLPVRRDYWRMKKDLFKTSWSKHMSRDRFIGIWRFLKLEDKNRKDINKNDRMWRMRWFMDYLVERFQALYEVDGNVSIDESMVKFKGRLSFRQYIPNKPIKWGVKLWVLAESTTGYCTNFQVYTGHEESPDAAKGLAHRVVMDLARPYLGSHVAVYMDNYYTSVDLLEEMKKRGLNACGTVRQNRKGLPPVEVLTHGQQLDRHEYRIAQKDDLTFCLWQDTKMVMVLSNHHDPCAGGTVNRRPEGYKQRAAKRKNTRFKKPEGFCEYRQHEVVVPAALADYQKHMKGVDLLDQMVGYYGFQHRSKKWWRRVFFFLLGTSCYNAYVAMRSYGGQAFRAKYHGYKNWLEDLAETLITPCTKRAPPTFVPPPPYPAGPTGPLVGAEPPRHDFAKIFIKRRICRECQCLPVDQRIKGQTCYGCRQCDVALHMECMGKHYRRSWYWPIPDNKKVVRKWDPALTVVRKLQAAFDDDKKLKLSNCSPRLKSSSASSTSGVPSSPSTLTPYSSAPPSPSGSHEGSHGGSHDDSSPESPCPPISPSPSSPSPTVAGPSEYVSTINFSPPPEYPPPSKSRDLPSWMLANLTPIESSSPVPSPSATTFEGGTYPPPKLGRPRGRPRKHVRPPSKPVRPPPAPTKTGRPRGRPPKHRPSEPPQATAPLSRRAPRSPESPCSPDPPFVEYVAPPPSPGARSTVSTSSSASVRRTAPWTKNPNARYAPASHPRPREIANFAHFNLRIPDHAQRADHASYASETLEPSPPPSPPVPTPSTSALPSTPSHAPDAPAESPAPPGSPGSRPAATTSSSEVVEEEALEEALEEASEEVHNYFVHDYCLPVALNPNRVPTPEPQPDRSPSPAAMTYIQDVHDYSAATQIGQDFLSPSCVGIAPRNPCQGLVPYCTKRRILPGWMLGEPDPAAEPSSQSTGSAPKKAKDASSSADNGEKGTPKKRGPRKPKDPNAPPRVRAPRKPKDPNAPPRIRAPRKPKDPNAPPRKRAPRKPKDPSSTASKDTSSPALKVTPTKAKDPSSSASKGTPTKAKDTSLPADDGSNRSVTLCSSGYRPISIFPPSAAYYSNDDIRRPPSPGPSPDFPAPSSSAQHSGHDYGFQFRHSVDARNPERQHPTPSSSTDPYYSHAPNLHSESMAPPPHPSPRPHPTYPAYPWTAGLHSTPPTNPYSSSHGPNPPSESMAPPPLPRSHPNFPPYMNSSMSQWNPYAPPAPAHLSSSWNSVPPSTPLTAPYSSHGPNPPSEYPYSSHAPNPTSESPYSYHAPDSQSESPYEFHDEPDLTSESPYSPRGPNPPSESRRGGTARRSRKWRMMDTAERLQPAGPSTGQHVPPHQEAAMQEPLDYSTTYYPHASNPPQRARAPPSPRSQTVFYKWKLGIQEEYDARGGAQKKSKTSHSTSSWASERPSTPPSADPYYFNASNNPPSEYRAPPSPRSHATFPTYANSSKLQWNPCSPAAAPAHSASSSTSARSSTPWTTPFYAHASNSPSEYRAPRPPPGSHRTFPASPPPSTSVQPSPSTAPYSSHTSNPPLEDLDPPSPDSPPTFHVMLPASAFADEGEDGEDNRASNASTFMTKT